MIHCAVNTDRGEGISGTLTVNNNNNNNNNNNESLWFQKK